MKTILTRKWLRAVSASVAVGLAANSQALHAQGIPVFDAQAIAQAIITVQNLQQQVTQLAQTYGAMTGGRGFGDLLSNPVVAQSLPRNWQSIYSAIQSGGYGGLTGPAQALRAASQIYNCEGLADVDLQICQRSLNKSFQDKALAQQAYQTELSELQQIQSLLQQISQTQDPKGIAELQARIAGEQAAIGQETTKLQLFKMMSETEDRLIEQQKLENAVVRAGKTGSISQRMQPVTFN